MIYYTIESRKQVRLSDTKFLIVAIIRCLLDKNAYYVFKFRDCDLIGCSFNKERYKYERN